MGNMSRGSIKLAKLEYVDGQATSRLDRLRRHDVLFNTRNTLDLVGKVVIWRDELPEAYFNSNILRMEFAQSHVGSNRFMNYLLNTRPSLQALRAIATGTTSVAAIYTRDLMKVMLALPTPSEQRAIADVLTDIDAEIDALVKRVEKARKLKQGMMQQLLTGRIRLL